MKIVYLDYDHKTGVVIASPDTMEEAVKLRLVTGDLLFNDDGTINLSYEWLFAWERNNPICHARAMQRKKITLDGIKLMRKG